MGQKLHQVKILHHFYDGRGGGIIRDRDEQKYTKKEIRVIDNKSYKKERLHSKQGIFKRRRGSRGWRARKKREGYLFHFIFCMELSCELKRYARGFCFFFFLFYDYKKKCNKYHTKINIS